MWSYINPPRSDELYHFGVLGMKWGKRKTDTSSESNSNSSSGKNINSKGIDLDQLDKGLDELIGTPAGDKLARKRLKPPREAPMYQWTDEEIDKFEADYDKARTSLRKAIDAAKDTKIKTTLAIENYNLEDFHLTYHEWD